MGCAKRSRRQRLIAMQQRQAAGSRPLAPFVCGTLERQYGDGIFEKKDVGKHRQGNRVLLKGPHVESICAMDQLTAKTMPTGLRQVAAGY